MIEKDVVRVLYIDHVGFIGGAEISLISMIKSLYQTHQVQPLIILPEAGELKDTVVGSGFDVIIVPMVPLDISKNPFTLLGYLLHLIRYIVQICRVIREKRIDLVHANSIKSGILVGTAVWLMRRPLIWHIRDYYEKGWIRTLIIVWARMFATHIIVISKRVASMFGSISNCSIVYNGVDVAAFTPAVLKEGRNSLRQELALDPHVPIVGTIGQLSEWKGQHLFLLAAEQILQQYPNVHFIIVGDNYARQDDAYKNKLLQLAQERLPNGSISFLGWRKDIVAIMGAIDVVIHMAKEEPFGRVVIEAMAAETPVIGSNSGGLPEIIENGVTGYLVSLDDLQNVTETAVCLLQDQQLRQKMGRTARIRTENHFSVQGNAKKVLQIYERVLARKTS
jgi:L-malate glycosyltransferase